MGGGDLNMKKSWHPLLMKNQERVWLEEKKALEEKKKLDQLRKEKEEERQLQELQRLQEEQTGKKRTDKLEWMYATPASGSGANPNDLEDYLLGKKRVDKILTADEHAKLGASHKNFIAVQNANNTRDIAAKIREDPLLAIKQQEQAAYQALMSNPLRLRELQERNGIKVKKDKKEKKKEKEEKKRRRHEEKQKRRHRDSRSRSPRSRSRSPADVEDRRHKREPSPGYYRRSRSPRPSYREYDRRHRDGSSDGRKRYSPEEDNRRHSLPSRSSRYPERNSDTSESPGPGERSKRPRSRSPRWNGDRNDRFDKRSRVDRSPPPPRNERPSAWQNPSRNNGPTPEDRAAKLAAMQSNASSMHSERRERLTILLEKEKAELAEEEKKRSQGMSSYLNSESKRVFGGSGGLEDRIRRGRGGMVIDAD